MTGQSQKVELRPIAQARGMTRPGGFKAVSTGISFDGQALRLLVREASQERVFGTTVQPGWASFPKTHTETKYSAILLICSLDGVQEIPLSSLTDAFPKVQIFPNGEILVVSARCRKFRDGTYELNATTYDDNGRVIRQFLLGDGIEHVQTDRDGNIWVGYFDEGVYGNFGWDHPNGPVGTAGLTCFDDHGKKRWSYEPPSGFDPISDCYALNVSKDGVWAYYYTGFPFVHIDSEWKVRAWQAQTAGGRELAVHGKHILHYGGYGEQRTSCRILELKDDTAQLVSQVSLLLSSDVDLSKSTVIGRDNKLHVFFGDDWYVFSADSVA